ncbi:MAG: hypothetical protein ACYST0_12155 [Planctomycetota bacterium]|jgi:hypothetical protein
MQVFVNERQAWVRTQTHTVVFDHDPEFARFRTNPSGQLKGLLRVWLVENGGGLRSYVGACRTCAGRLEWSDLLRLFRRIRLLAEGRKLRRELRQAIVARLRRYRFS